MASSAVAAVNNFETNAGSFPAGKNRGMASPGGAAVDFRQFLNAKRKDSGRAAAAPERPIKPTRERLTKEDTPQRTYAGFYRAPAPIERLKDQGKLDPNAQVNLAMYNAANKLFHHFYQGGLRGIAAQDLSRCAGGGDGGACQFPKDEHAMFHRQKFREATRIMGWHEAAPYRGAGRLVVDVICYEMPIRDASSIHVRGSRAETTLAAGMDRLREGLFALTVHWKL